MYIFGAYVRQYNVFEKVNKLWFLLTYVVSSSTIFLSFVIFEQYENRPFRAVIPNNVLMTYTSPFMVLSAVSLLIFCSKIKLNNKNVKKAVGTLSSLSFGVYVIHLHKLFWNNYIKDAFKKYSELEPLVLIGAVILTATAIYAACSVVEWLRTKLFKLFKIDKLGILIGDKIDSILKPEM